MLRLLQFEAAQRHNPAMLSLLGTQWLGQQKTVDAPEGVPAKSFMPTWLEQMFKAEADKAKQEALSQNPDDRATRIGGSQHSHVEVSRSHKPTMDVDGQQDE